MVRRFTTSDWVETLEDAIVVLEETLASVELLLKAHHASRTILSERALTHIERQRVAAAVAVRELRAKLARLTRTQKNDNVM
jgi:hypothetical protein